MDPIPSTERIRAFCALDLPGEVQAALTAWGDGELTDPALRRTRPGGLHATLSFLGGIDAASVPIVAAAVSAIPEGPVRLALAPAPVLRPRRAPRFVALEIESPDALGLQAALAARLRDEGLTEPDERPYWPHVTVARVRTQPGSRRARRVMSPPGALPEALTRAFDAVRVSLYRSILRPEGSEYIRLAGKDLPPTA